MKKRLCESCQKNKAEVFFENSFCSRCFVKVFERRVENHLKKSGLNKENNMLFVEDDTLKSHVAKHLIESFLKTRKLTKKLEKIGKKGEGISRFKGYIHLFPLCADDYINSFMKNFFSKGYNSQTKEASFVFILLPVSYKEIITYWNIKQKTEEKKGFINLQIKENPDYELWSMNKKYPQTTHSFAKSIKTLTEILNGR